MASKPPSSKSDSASRKSAAARDEEGARAMGMAPRKGSKGSGKGGKGSGKGGGKSKGALGWVRAWVKTLLVASTLGGVLGGATALAVCYRGAVERVDASLRGPVWSVPGHVWSAPVEVWPGLRTTPEDVATTLIAAGYTRVDKAERAGDVQVGDGTMMVINRAAQGYKPASRAGRTPEVMLTFRDGRVRSVSPGSRATFAPARLATVRGADNENRSPVPLEKIPLVLRQAVLATEDARFYDHPGVDAVGLARALAVDLWHQDMVQGGSTLTQQVAKNIFLTQDRTAARKFQEVLLAFALERKLSKDAILELYLNEIYMGQGGGASLCGMDAASKAWFGKPVERVDLVEAATLAGAIASPNGWSPIRHPEASKNRRNIVLSRMVDAGFLTLDQSKAAREVAVVTAPVPSGRRAPYAVDRALEDVERSLGEGAVARDGLDVRTSIQPLVQLNAERALADGFAEVLAAHPGVAGAQAAVVVLRASDGAIVAQVGGMDWERSSFDRATDAVREIGSTVKPLTLLFALEADPTLSPALRFEDAAIVRTHDGKDWSPANFDKNFVGPISIRHAIAHSRNIPAVLLAERVGLDAERDGLRGLGLSRATNFPSVALGGFGASPVDLAAAYGIFAGEGRYHAPWVTAGAWRGEGVRLTLAAAKGPAYSARARWLASDVMRSVMSEGTGKAARRYGVGPGAAGKSGTTDATKDGWFAGVSGGYSVVVWVGFDDGKALGLTGSAAALPIWARVVDALGNSATVPAAPDGVESAVLCDATDLPVCEGCESTHTEWFSEGTVPVIDCAAQAVPPVAGAPTERPGVFQTLGELLGIGKP
jgi:penicillin-binding protein 1B